MFNKLFYYIEHQFFFKNVIWYHNFWTNTKNIILTKEHLYIKKSFSFSYVFIFEGMQTFFFQRRNPNGAIRPIWDGGPLSFKIIRFILFTRQNHPTSASLILFSRMRWHLTREDINCHSFIWRCWDFYNFWRRFRPSSGLFHFILFNILLF